MEPGVILMSTYVQKSQLTSGYLEPAPAPEGAGPPEAAAANEHSECPYCGETGRRQLRRYRFCGHDAPSAVTHADR